MRKLLSNSIFHQRVRDLSMDGVLALMFHRVAATAYLSLAVWATVSLAYFWPDLLYQGAEAWRAMFSIGVLVMALPSALGATFWPVFARLEAFSSAGLAGVITGYTLTVMLSDADSVESWRFVSVLIGMLILPSCRWVIVMLFLLRQAGHKKATVEEARRRLQGDD